MVKCRVVRIQPRQKHRDFRTSDMGGDAERETTTGSVSSDRAGMASGIDMSARMVSLATNIAVMGFILVSGVLAHLKAVLPALDAAQMRLLAERIAAGSTVSVGGLTDSVAREALANGFGWVMLYGGVGVWIMAGTSLFIFNARSVRQAKVQCPD